VLILVLVVVALLSLTAFTFSDLMLTEREAAIVSGQSAQSRALADSGVDALRAFLMLDPESRRDAGGIFDNEIEFRGRVVLEDADDAFRGRFCVIAPLNDEEGYVGAGLRYGLENESARINLNALLLAELQGEEGSRDQLLALPGMTEEIADAILDWIDEDDEPREYGAEIDYYSGLPVPYAPKNGTFDSVEELLLVRGVTSSLLYGLDQNRNGIVDPHEEGGVIEAETADNTDGVLDRGWAAYFTLYSEELNLTSQGEPRIFLNMEDMQQLYDELSAVFGEASATFIVAYRQNGPYRGNDEGEVGATGDFDLSQPGRFPFSQVLDLVDQKVRIQFEGEDQPTVIGTTFPDGPIAMSTYLPQLMEHCTVYPDPTIPGRININEAPRAVLQAIPGMDVDLVDAIIGARIEDPDEENELRKHETWLMTSALVSLDEMKALIPYVTTGGDVYRAQVVGYFDRRGPTTRLEVVLDATQQLPTVLMWRDISHLGRGHPLETLGIDVVVD
jgi:hypothetical protein